MCWEVCQFVEWVFGESAPKKWGWGLPFCREVALGDFEGILIL